MLPRIPEELCVPGGMVSTPISSHGAFIGADGFLKAITGEAVLSLTVPEGVGLWKKREINGRF